MKFKTGDRVIYTSGCYGVGKRNPLIGSEFFCVGIIIEFKPYIRVKWDNGEYNNYKEGDLQLYKKKGINMNLTIIKKTVEKAYGYIKPYEKYIGIIALAVIIDHFLLGNKFSNRFKNLAEGLVERITDTMDILIKKLTPKLELDETEKSDGGE